MAEQKAETTTTGTTGTEQIINKEGCLRGAAIIFLIFLVLIGTLALVIYMNPGGILRYGLISNINDMENRLELERTLPPEQYQEMKIYLQSFKQYVLDVDLNKETVSRIRPLNQTFKDALQDGQIGRSEIAEIRTAVWKSNIPLNVPRRQQKQQQQTKPAPPAQGPQKR